MFVSNQSSCRKMSWQRVREFLAKFLLPSVRNAQSASPISMATSSRWQSQIPLVKTLMLCLNSRLQVTKRIPSPSWIISESHRWSFLVSSRCSKMIIAPSVRTKYLMQINFWAQSIAWFMYHYQQRLSSLLFFRHNVSKIQEHCKSGAF